MPIEKKDPREELRRRADACDEAHREMMRILRAAIEEDQSSPEANGRLMIACVTSMLVASDIVKSVCASFVPLAETPN